MARCLLILMTKSEKPDQTSIIDDSFDHVHNADSSEGGRSHISILLHWRMRRIYLRQEWFELLDIIIGHVSQSYGKIMRIDAMRTFISRLIPKKFRQTKDTSDCSYSG